MREIVHATGNIITVAGDGSCGYSGDGLATSNDLYYPQGVWSDANGNLFISDTSNQILRWVTPTGQMTTFAGTADSGGFSGDGRPALSAKFSSPEQIAQDSAGNFYVADYYNFRVRKVTPFAGFGLSAANLSFETQPAGTTSDFQPITVSAVGPTTISGVTVGSNFSEIDDCAGTSLTAGQTCEIDVYFNPTAAGQVVGTLSIASNAKFATTQLNSVSLSGTASGLTLTGSLAFDTTAIGTPVTQTVTLKNSGAKVTLGRIFITDTTDFSISGGTCPTAGSLATGASCTITVKFSPATTGSKKGTLAINSSDPASPLLAQATGTGVAATKAVLTTPAPGSTLPGTSVTFSWTATGSPGYWLFLGTTGAGSKNLYDSGEQAATSATVSGLPTNGETIYARLYTLINGTLEYNDYTYTAH